ncbi:hypothetical protein N9V54_03120, partial [Planktomarina temperata]|nr:hypothetical protein [Planktomarina temperata]
YSLLPEIVQENYSHLNHEDVNQLLDETWVPGWEYEEVVGFKERARSGEHVNVNSFGFRSTLDGEEFRNFLDGGIWFFGGSTTFGYGVRDDETIPSTLDKLLDENVVNLGRGYYYSHQENLLLEALLSSGVRPSSVVFLDGINERCSIRTYQQQMATLFESAQNNRSSIPEYAFSIIKPLFNFTLKVFRKLGVNLNVASQSEDLQSISCNVYGSNMNLEAVLRTNLAKRQQVCNFYQIECRTFLQPFAGTHGMHLSLIDLNETSRQSLEQKFEHLHEAFLAHEVNDITTALDDLNAHAFIDGVHYSYDANKLLAQAIHSEISVTP